MNTIRIKAAAAIAVAAVLTTGGVTAAQVADSPPADDPAIPAVDGGDQAAGAHALASNCKKTYNSGAGLTRFSWCFSNDGNVVKIEHSAGLEHVRIGGYYEGFCVSSNGVQRAQSFGDLANVGLNAPTYPSASKVQHTTTDGVWKIEQTFAQNTGQKQITITMKLTNTSGVQQNSVFLTRAVDADMSNTTGSDDFSAGSRSVMANEPGSSRLELLPTSTNFTVNSMIYPGVLPVVNQFCYDPASDAVNSATGGDQSMGVLYQLGSVLPGGSKTAKFVYQVSI
jgi:hypothetical protein